MYEKIKKIFNIIWLPFSFIFTTLLGINYFRNRTIKRNLQRVNEQLGESDRIIKEQQITNKELTKQLEQSRNIVSELKSKFENSKRTVSELEVIDREIGKESERTSEILIKLRKFIDENSGSE